MNKQYQRVKTLKKYLAMIGAFLKGIKKKGSEERELT